MSKVTVYTINCPACKILEKKLQGAGIEYDIFDKEEEMQHI